MRKIIFPAMIVLMSVLSGEAQINKGSIFLGGDFRGGTQKTDYETGTDFKASGITILPVFGSFIKENLVLGVNLGFNLTDTKNDLYVEYKLKTYQAGVFIRKYKNIGASGFYIFGQGGLAAGYYKQEADAPDNGYDDEFKRTSVSINAFPGISFAVSKRFHLETGFNDLISLSYFTEERNENSPNISGYTSRGFNISTSLNNATSSFYLGFRVLLSK